MTTQYDYPDFFAAYAQMARSQYGLKGAGEWQTLREILPNLKAKNVLDLGCGYGWHCKYAAEQGASQVIGVDSSTLMIEKAAELNTAPQINYLIGDIEHLALPETTFDLIISSLVIHYIADLETLFQNIYDLLAPAGEFIMTVEHPAFTAEGSQNWIYDNGQIAHFPVDQYFVEGARSTNFLGHDIKKYHHTLTSYFSALTKAGFTVEKLIEPTPPAEMMDLEGMSDELRRPMMLIIKGKK